MLLAALGGISLPVLHAGSQRLAAGVISPDAARLAATSFGLNPWAVATDLAALDR
jgi:hypothetical protein